MFNMKKNCFSFQKMNIHQDNYNFEKEKYFTGMRLIFLGIIFFFF